MPTVIDRSHFDIPDWLVSYHNDWLRPDIVAGLTAAAVVIPKSMAGAPVRHNFYKAGCGKDSKRGRCTNT